MNQLEDIYKRIILIENKLGFKYDSVTKEESTIIDNIVIELENQRSHIDRIYKYIDNMADKLIVSSQNMLEKSIREDYSKLDSILSFLEHDMTDFKEHIRDELLQQEKRINDLKIMYSKK